MSKDDIFDQFNSLNELLDNGFNDGFVDAFSSPGLNNSNRYIPGDDDSEELFTSKEIVKMKEVPKDDEGKVIPKPIPNNIEESVHFKTYRKKHVHKYTETEMASIRESCMGAIVYDYAQNDSYHISDEEREKADTLREVRVQLGGLHKLYNKVDEWIKAMRVVMKAWAILEEKGNFLHSKDEFYKLVAEDRIYHNAIIMPKLKGMSKYNIDILIQYISNPDLDPSDLLTTEQKRRAHAYDSFYDDEEDEETEEEKMERLLDPEDVDVILNASNDQTPTTIACIPDKDIVGYEQSRYSPKKLKKLPKRKRKHMYSRYNLHALLTKIQNNPENRDTSSLYGYGYSSIVTRNMFEPEKHEDDFWDENMFHGSWASKTDNEIYDIQLREAMMNRPIPGSVYKTYGDEELNSFFNDLEKAGLNVLELRRLMNMTEADDASKNAERVKKETKKLENAILQRITKLNGDPKFKKTIEKAEKAIAADSQ